MVQWSLVSVQMSVAFRGAECFISGMGASCGSLAHGGAVGTYEKGDVRGGEGTGGLASLPSPPSLPPALHQPLCPRLRGEPLRLACHKGGQDTSAADG